MLFLEADRGNHFTIIHKSYHFGSPKCKQIGKFTRAKVVKGSLCYVAQYPVRWTVQSASHFFPPLAILFIPTPFSASPGSILAMQQLRAMNKSLASPPLPIARYSFKQLSQLGRQWRERKCPVLETLAWGNRTRAHLIASPAFYH